MKNNFWSSKRKKKKEVYYCFFTPSVLPQALLTPTNITHTIKTMQVGWIILITLDYIWPDRISSFIARRPELCAHSNRRAHLFDILCLPLLLAIGNWCAKMENDSKKKKKKKPFQRSIFCFVLIPVTSVLASVLLSIEAVSLRRSQHHFKLVRLILCPKNRGMRGVRG